MACNAEEYENEIVMPDAGAHEEEVEEEVEEEEEDDETGGQQQQQPKLMAPALISIHPKGSIVVVSVGAGFRVFDLENNAAMVPIDTTSHRAAIRAAEFDWEGEYFVSAGDDKLVKLWDSRSWKCLKTILVNKKTSAITFSRDSRWLMVADKFGVVYVMPTVMVGDNNASVEPVQLLAHCCSIITSLESSPCDKFVVTADRDFKIRVSVLPKQPLSEAYEIQSFCLGHTSFVTCVSFVTDRLSSEALLVSGGGDATIRLWNYETGKLLDTLEIANIVEEAGSASVPAVLEIAVSSSVVAATIERFTGVLLLSCDANLKKLSFRQKILLEEPICPTGLRFDQKERLWLVTGAAETREVGDRLQSPEQVAEMTAQAQAGALTAVTRVRVLQKVAVGKLEYAAVKDTEVPGGDALLKTLQGHEADSSIAAAAAAAAAEAAELAMKNLLSKRQYTQAQRDKRKRFRNDKKALGEGNNVGNR